MCQFPRESVFLNSIEHQFTQNGQEIGKVGHKIHLYPYVKYDSLSRFSVNSCLLYNLLPRTHIYIISGRPTDGLIAATRLETDVVSTQGFFFFWLHKEPPKTKWKKRDNPGSIQLPERSSSMLQPTVSTGLILRQERIVHHIQRTANLLLLRRSVLFQENVTAKLRQHGRGTQYTLLR